jgi:galactose oxidase
MSIRSSDIHQLLPKDTASSSFIMPSISFLARLCVVALSAAHVQAQTPLAFNATALVRTSWTVVADSYETINPPSYAIDGNTSTFWHSEYTPVLEPLPHNLTFNLGAVHDLSALTYLPRQDGNNNGHIGQHMIEVSTDNVHWTTVVIGTWVDDANLKTSIFQTTPGQYVRLIGLTEAGNRGPWSSAAEVNIYALPSYTPPSTALGLWGPTIDFPVVPVSATILSNSGELLVWSSYSPYSFSGSPGDETTTATFNPATNGSTPATVTNTDQDMFCVGLSVLNNGYVLVAGK